jgi:hypothetical protein
MTHWRRLAGGACAAAAALPLLALAGLRNGDFSQGLRFWKTAWPATVADGALVLSDARTTHSFAFQSAPCAPGSALTVEFDFYNALATTNAQGTFRDSFYASLYQVDDPARFVLENDRFDRAQGLLDLDAGGVFNVNGAVTNSVRGSGWQHFTGTVTAAHSNAVVVFELYDLNLAAGDSAVRIANVGVGAAN